MILEIRNSVKISNMPNEIRSVSIGAFDMIADFWDLGECYCWKTFFWLIPFIPLFCYSWKIKIPELLWNSGIYIVLLFFKVVPPGIEPFNLIYSNSLIDSIFLLYILWKPLNWLYTKFIAFLYQFDNHYPFDSAKIEKMFDFRKNISVFLLIKFSIG